eukprot:NODE_2328_length_718_cov_78.427504_g1886_i0.p3 GENE.NODE_2328_length_718_cov_78.427504_g1886_i0~~NODE_2328_length_718_cov_78.427504_g1886_i0.p3  ORF type:complete len:56 (+),score=3.42 NODE_2328_length_718_cov_78.427504_g1886_i0:44-211(+)
MRDGIKGSESEQIGATTQRGTRIPPHKPHAACPGEWQNSGRNTALRTHLRRTAHT